MIDLIAKILFTLIYLLFIYKSGLITFILIFIILLFRKKKKNILAGYLLFLLSFFILKPIFQDIILPSLYKCPFTEYPLDFDCAGYYFIHWIIGYLIALFLGGIVGFIFGKKYYKLFFKN